MSGKNLVRKEFESDGTWVAPGGVTQVKVTANLLLFSQLAAGTDCGFATTMAGDLYGWGANTKGQVGDGTVVGKSSPILVLGTFKWRQVVATSISSGNSVYGISTVGDLYAWGINANGQLGLGDVTARSSPVIVLEGLKWRYITAGSTNVGGLTADGNAYCWGLNANGQLGVGDVTVRSSPVLVLGGHLWTRLAAGGSFTMGIDTNGNLYAWGLNTSGQLGVGDVTPRSSPVLVLGGRTWKSVAIGDSHAIAMDSLNNVYAWGLNTNGQLGVGDVTPRSSPVLVLGGLKWRYISAGVNSNIGITTGGDAYGWGYNASGQLGDSSTTPRSSPVIVAGSLKWRQVSMGGATATGWAMGITTTGRVYTWGDNAAAQLASGTLVGRSSPVVYLGSTYLPQNPTVYQSAVNILWADVVPGTTYAISMLSLTSVFFNYQGVYQDPYGNTAVPVRVTLEYQA